MAVAMVPFAQGRSSAATRLGTDALAAALKGALAAVAKSAKRMSVTGRSARRTRSQPTAPASSATTMTRRRSNRSLRRPDSGPTRPDDAGRRDQRRRHPQGGVRPLVDGEREGDLRGVRATGRREAGSRQAADGGAGRGHSLDTPTTLWTVRRACSPIQKKQATVRPLGSVRRTWTRRVVGLGIRVDAHDQVVGSRGVLEHVPDLEVVGAEEDAASRDPLARVAVEGRARLEGPHPGGDGGGGHAVTVRPGADERPDPTLTPVGEAGQIPERGPGAGVASVRARSGCSASSRWSMATSTCPSEGPSSAMLLLLLLVRARETVQAERLADELWGDDPPGRRRQRAAGARLEAAAGAGPAERRLDHGGRRLPARCGRRRDRRAVLRGGRQRGRDALAAGAVEDAAAVLGDALGLWRGPALDGDDDSDLLRREAVRLEELRWAVLEDRIDADLRRVGMPSSSPSSSSWSGKRPLRERLHGFLMLALYRAGRQAEALRAYQHARDVLGEELGLDPGPELQALEAAILAQDPSLDLEPRRRAVPARRRSNLTPCAQLVRRSRRRPRGAAGPGR